MQRYFAKSIIDDNITLYDTDIYHIKKVMRMKQGSKIEVVYNEVIYECNINSLDPLFLEVLSKKKPPKKDYEIVLAVALVKEQKMDLILQKATELGISKIIPLNMMRSIVKLDKQRFLKKKERWKMICKEASEQSFRIDIPEIMDIMNIKDLQKYSDYLKFACLVSEENKTFKNYEKDIKDKKRIIVVIGPEGGISKEEEDQLDKLGFLPLSLHSNVLRVETAVFNSLSVLTYIME